MSSPSSNYNISINNNDQSNISKSTSSVSSSLVKLSPPGKQPWLLEENNPQGDITSSNKSWKNQRWSTLSGSLIIYRKKKKLTASQLWLNKQKRTTFPPSLDILKHEVKLQPPQRQRQSMQDALSSMYRESQHESQHSTSSSSLSNRIGKILKRKGKQPYKRKKDPQLTIETSFTEQDLKSAAMHLFQPPPTISSESTTPTTSPVKFPTPPTQFSAYFIDIEGRTGKVKYKNPTKRPHCLRNYFLPDNTTGPTQKLTLEELTKYNQRLSMDTLLFLFGFLFFPCWWAGLGMFLYRNYRYDRIELVEEYELYSIRTIGYLNTVFSVFSLFLMVIILVLVALMVKAY
ncbi:uncharacterized protein B0P05DRAFT_560818 [Gilbertella persicaria]|uniref:uncharacterized protein n=1 Tax=Gilbertella persicaria TaxID=101096 RepID=UPI00221ED284|nr:uncharacterized protein B0P05DRAFT_560818 [Gilbertella persicaria]KAI8054934.1 hypothetical protein B0P05DRAFT_560818 [Gilbertella persicaria]